MKIITDFGNRLNSVQKAIVSKIFALVTFYRQVQVLGLKINQQILTKTTIQQEMGVRK